MSLIREDAATLGARIAAKEVECVLHAFELVGREVARSGERRGVCLRARDVVGREHPVEVRRTAQRRKFGRGPARKARSPEGTLVG